MSVDAAMLDGAYVGVFVGSIALLGLLWRMMPWLLKEAGPAIDGSTPTCTKTAFKEAGSRTAEASSQTTSPY